MPYKDYNKAKEKSREYYYDNRAKVLAYQTARWKRKYKEDMQFRAKRQLRDKSRIDKSKIDGCCDICSTKKDLQRHHPNYASTFFTILCRVCHNKLHSIMKEKSYV